MNAVFRYPGSKWSLAEWIISHFPDNYEKMVYVEPFIGSGAVFFKKNPGAVETINDLDSDIVNLFYVLREYPEELIRGLSLTPYSREEYDKSFAPCEDPVEKARRYMVKTTQAIGAKLGGSKCGWRNHKQSKVGGTACKWGNITTNVWAAAERLKGDTTHLVQIEHTDALDLIERYNNSETLMYLDPPYMQSSRKNTRYYLHEMSEDEHNRMLDIILESKAKIILSGYESPLYSERLKDWRCFHTQSQTTSAEMADEFIWLNYEPPNEQISLF